MARTGDPSHPRTHSGSATKWTRSWCSSCAGDDDIQTAECLHRRGGGRLDLLLMTDVGGSCQSLVASALQCCSHLGNPVRGHTGDGDGCSLACHVPGAGGADSRSTPRSAQLFHPVSSPTPLVRQHNLSLPAGQGQTAPSYLLCLQRLGHFGLTVSRHDVFSMRNRKTYVARSSRGLGRWPLTPVTRVRIPYGLPY